MKIPRGNFGTKQPGNYEEEKATIDGSIGGGADGSPSSNILDLDEEDAIDDLDAQDVLRAPPQVIRPKHNPPSSVQAPKPLSDMPVNTIMKERLKSKGSTLPPFLSSPPDSPSLDSKKKDKMGANRARAPTISPRDRDRNSNNDEGFDQSNHKQHHQPTSAASFVVCSVDGTVYTIDAYTGHLRGMFASGPALVHSSSPEDNDANVHDDEDVDFSDDEAPEDKGGDTSPMNNKNLIGDESNAIISTGHTRSGKEKVVPGLDGRLYEIVEKDVLFDQGDQDCEDAGEYDDLDGSCEDHGSAEQTFSNNDDTTISVGTYSLEPLPFYAMDAVDSPISICRRVELNGLEREQCGIIVGSKKTTIYAIDPTTGQVRWTQDPNGGAGGRGFTKTRPKRGQHGKTVLLQREDFALRQLDTEGGDEEWKVELGKFSALDFDIESRTDDSGGSAGSKSRGAAAAAATQEKKKTNVPPILAGREKASYHGQHAAHGEKENLFEHDDEDEFRDHTHFRAFPSIAFGEDGTRIMAVDKMTNKMLWDIRIESVVAAVYGVGRQSSWVNLDVIDIPSVFNSNRMDGLPEAPTSSLNSGGLVPYGAGKVETGELRLGRHHTNLFVSSKFEASGDNAEPIIDGPGIDSSLPQADGSGIPLSPRVTIQPTEDQIITISPSQISMPGVRPPPSHRTEHGLYLTWTMVAAIVLLGLSVVVVVARIIILRQKRKWENTPSLDPTTAPSLSEDGRERSRSRSQSGDLMLPPAVSQTMATPATSNLRSNNGIHLREFTRSFSLDALTNSLGSIGAKNNATQPFISQNGNGNSIIRQPTESKSALKPLPSPGRSSSIPTTVGTTVTPSSPTIARSMTLPPETSPSLGPVEDKLNPQQSHPGVDNIDGIPLVRYSRYRSEFEEKSALGSGGFGTVFQCKNALDSREYAIKKIKIVSQLSLDGTVTKNFSQKLHRVLREVKILALLDHPNIVRYYTAWLEVDDGLQHDDDDTNTTSSILGRQSHSIFSSGLFSGFGSNSRALQTSFSPNKGVRSNPNKALLGSYNPLGWNNFGSSFRLDEAQSEASSSFGEKRATLQTVPSRLSSVDDLGFNWERSNEHTVEPSTNGGTSSRKLKNETTTKQEDSDSSDSTSSDSNSGISSVDSQDSSHSSKDEVTKEMTSWSVVPQSKSVAKKTVQLPEPKKEGDSEKKTTEGRHILFIQMQLCSSQTLADFLTNHKARSGSLPTTASYAIDIPYALRLFAQIACGVKYVHKQGLIHRDLKPQNCFIDESGIVKVGDFGLSRSSATDAITDDDNDETSMNENGQADDVSPPSNIDAENTAGVGTRSYASPEQMRGSNYDASTDIYSLGLILFELCSPPMLTAMERYKEFGGIRKGHFPSSWNSHVKTPFPTLHELLVQMISGSASERPSADAVSDRIESLLREYSIQSLDKAWGEKGALLLRVEAEEKEGGLANTMKLLKEAAPQATILQYGLRGQASKAIMEFALEVEDDQKNSTVEMISSSLQANAMAVRRVNV